MKTSERIYRFHPKLLVWIATAAAFILLIPLFTSGSEAGNENQTFKYLRENRPDPFHPFITEKSSSEHTNFNEIIEPEGPLTGMQLFEPNQLNLVALLQTKGQIIAMVEDSTGKGYILQEGIQIGKQGVVTNITSTGVVIRETARTRAGKETITKIVMTLKKDEQKEQ